MSGLCECHHNIESHPISACMVEGCKCERYDQAPCQEAEFVMPLTAKTYLYMKMLRDLDLWLLRQAGLPYGVLRGDDDVFIPKEPNDAPKT